MLDFVVFQALISKDFDQRSLLRSLSIERLTECGVVIGECSCGVQMVHLAKICLLLYCEYLLEQQLQMCCR
jgi:hypothetical protein